MSTIQVDGITIEVIKKRIKSLRLKVFASDGKVSISAPMRMSLKAIENFIVSKLDWVKIQQSKFRERKKELPYEYLSGEKHFVWGKNYSLNIIENAKSPKIALEADKIYLHVPPNANIDKRQAIFESWYRKQLQEILPILIAKWEPIMNVKVIQFSIRKMKTRWGSCSYHSRKIRFNLELAKYSMQCLEYIVIHEMVHLLEPSHNQRFKDFMDKYMPDWRLYRKELKSVILS